MKSKPTDYTTTKIENTTRQAQEKGKQIVEQTKEQAEEIASETQQQVKSSVAARKAQAVGELGGVAEAFRATGDQLRRKDKAAIATYTDKVADQVEQLTRYLDEGRHYTANYGPSRQYRSPSEIGKTIHSKPGHVTDTQSSQHRPQVSKPYPGERYES